MLYDLILNRIYSHARLLNDPLIEFPMQFAYTIFRTSNTNGNMKSNKLAQRT